MLAAAITARTGLDETTAAVLAAAVAAAARVATEQWLRSETSRAGLADLLRGALSRITPALEAADR